MKKQMAHTFRIIAAALAIAMTTQIPAQTPPRPQVEVAAIHPSAPGGGDLANIHIAPGKFIASNMTVRKLISIAYKIRMDRLIGGPAWLNSEHYDITATVEDMTGDNFPLTLQTLLEDRFKLKLHPETRETAVYDLIIAKGGSKLQPTKPGTCLPLNLSKTRPAQTPDQRVCSWRETRPGLRNGTGISITDPPGVALQGLTGQLSNILDKPVIDQTGLAGLFDIHLEWAPDDTTLNPADTPGPIASSETAPTIFTAVREQLGLELKPAKGPVPFLEIDNVDRPSEN
jgi:uncharacterized protein (TIGR03435 family)